MPSENIMHKLKQKKGSCCREVGAWQIVSLMDYMQAEGAVLP